MLNHKLIQQKLNANAKKLVQVEFIYQEVAKRMIDRLDYIKIMPQNILDLGSGLNIDAKLLASKYPKSDIYKIDLAINLLKEYHSPQGFFSKVFKKNQMLVCANALQLPIASQSINLVWANLILPYIDDLNGYFKEVNRVLALGGTFLVSGFGVDSLQELRDIGLNTYNFPDMHIIGDILVKLGFTDPVTDVEHITIEYDTLAKLLNEIRLIGCGAATNTKLSRLTTQDYRTLDKHFIKSAKSGKYTLTLEVFYAHAWKDKVMLNLTDGVKPIQFY